jgi:hypothetical protein
MKLIINTNVLVSQLLKEIGHFFIAYCPLPIAFNNNLFVLTIPFVAILELLRNKGSELTQILKKRTKISFYYYVFCVNPDQVNFFL